MSDPRSASLPLLEAQHARAPGDAPPAVEGDGPSGVLVYSIGLLLALVLTATLFWVGNMSLLWGPGVQLGLACLP